MLRPAACAALTACLVSVSGGVAADQPEDADAAMAAAKRIADCPTCTFDFPDPSPQRSARRGLVSVGVGDPAGGGYVMIMAYTGSRWARLWEGNGSTQNVESLPGRTVVCMAPGGWTNIRSGPGLAYRRIGKVTRPTRKRVFEARLTKPLGRSDGEAWFRISFNGERGWVQNLRTLAFGYYGSTAAETCENWLDLYA